jgi:hypothetical protein
MICVFKVTSAKAFLVDETGLRKIPRQRFVDREPPPGAFASVFNRSHDIPACYFICRHSE